MRTYPSKNRDVMRLAIMEEVQEWKHLTSKDDQEKAMKKLRMLYGHLAMWQVKMAEVNRTDTEQVRDSLPYGDINKK